MPHVNKILLKCILTIALAGCGAQQITKSGDNLIKLSSFFSSTEESIGKAAKSIEEQHLIRNLTHLNKMNSGGSHYYPLERESITEMIRKLSSIRFTECLLISSAGIIIYTMNDNEILGKNYSTFPLSPLPDLFSKSITGKTALYDLDVFPNKSGRLSIFFSIPVYSSGKSDGILICAADISEIEKIVPGISSITNSENVIKFDIVPENIGKNISNSASVRRTNPRLFTYRDINWKIYLN